MIEDLDKLKLEVSKNDLHWITFALTFAASQSDPELRITLLDVENRVKNAAYQSRQS